MKHVRSLNDKDGLGLVFKISPLLTIKDYENYFMSRYITTEMIYGNITVRDKQTQEFFKKLKAHMHSKKMIKRKLAKIKKMSRKLKEKRGLKNERTRQF